ncbi:CATRA conflict system CASPASE/TPR repeat-associated protein [Streptomyces sp. SLBN-8D4]|uniref:CATRA conflict system CASPASE/TPR repeat-associated protein n=1 Tax=Streptomyces sp. SLBN-8D4 TaxID=3377728 RepID=UPI003C7AAC05
MPLTEYSLVVHVYASVASDQSASLPVGLRTVWDRLADTLGMDRPAHGTGLAEALPGAGEVLPDGGAVAARRDDSGDAQAVLRRVDELLVLSVALSGTDWRETERRWESAAQDIEQWAWGEVRLYVAYCGEEDVPARELETALPGRGGRPAVLSPPVRLDGPRATLWEVQGPGERRLRRLVAVAPGAGDLPERLERWLWYERAATVPPFARYLAHTAKLRAQLRLPAVGASPGTTDLIAAALAEMRHDPDRTPPSRSVSQRAGELTSLRHRLLVALSGPGGLSRRLLDLRELQRSAEIAVSNMEGAAPPGGPLADDLAVSRWLRHRLEDSVAYLELDRERLRDALTVQAEEAVQLGREELQRRETELQSKQQRVNLLQTALIGAFLMVLTAVQAFDYRFSFLPQSAVPALIAFLGALTLWLSTLVVPLLSPRARRRQTRLGAACAGLVAAAFAWLTTAVGSVYAVGGPAPAALTLPASALGFGLGWWGMSRYTAVYRHGVAGFPDAPGF